MILEPLQVILRTAFPNRALEAGFSHDEIAAAEARLKVPLPEALKDYLALCGKTGEMMDGNCRLYSPDQLRMEGGYLIFCGEKKGTLEYGISAQELENLEEAPHPSVRYKRKNEETWFLEAGSISSFLLNVGSYQVVVSLAEWARFKLPAKRRGEALKFFEPVSELEAWMRGHFVDRERSIVATYMYDSHLYDPEMFWIGSSVGGALEAFEKRSGFELDWL